MDDFGWAWRRRAPRVVALLKSCANQKDLRKGCRLHADILRTGLIEKSAHVATSLISMYAKCGVPARAQHVFDEIICQSVQSWNAIIACHAQHEHYEEALTCFERMRCEAFLPDAVTFTCSLKACASVGAADKGEKIHVEVMGQELIGKDIVLDTAVFNMYVKCSALVQAQQVFDELPIRDVVTWSALLTGFVQHGRSEEALTFLQQMQIEGVSPNAVTFTSLFKACSSIRAIHMGKKFHDMIIGQCLIGKNPHVTNSLVDMYVKCGALENARRVLDELPARSLISWSTLIAGYVEQGQGEEALNCLKQMRSEGLSPDPVTFIVLLKACGSMGACGQAKEIHDEIIRQGLLERNSKLGNTLVGVYARCGALDKAKEMLDNLPGHDVVSWNVLIAGYIQQGLGEEALVCFRKLQHNGLTPNIFTFHYILKACSIIGAVDKGQQIHDEILERGLLVMNPALGNDLIDMYIKLGSLTKAQHVLEELPFRDVVSWTALITGYAQQGQSVEALDCFERMQLEGSSPNAVALAGVLNACSNSGLLHEGQMYFENMSTVYGLTPDIEHYSSMVDLNGRAGDFGRALQVINMMPFPDFLPVWSSLLGACRNWENMNLAKIAFDCSVQLAKSDAASYVCMSNIYTAAGMYQEAEEIEVIRLQNQAWSSEDGMY